MKYASDTVSHSEYYTQAKGNFAKHFDLPIETNGLEESIVCERYLNFDRIHDSHFQKFYTRYLLKNCSRKSK